MYKSLFYLLILFSNLVFANELDILSNDKKELRFLQKDYIQTDYEKTRNSWIGSININSKLSQNHSYSNLINDDEKNIYSKSVSVGFSQNIFQSGGILYTIQYAKEKLKYDLLSWENENKEILQTIYTTILEISKLKIQLEQSRYKLENKKIELDIKKIQYEVGKVDITELNNSVMNKNAQIKEILSLEKSLKDKEIELLKYTDLKYDDIKMLNFLDIDKQRYVNNNIDVLIESSKINVLGLNQKITRTNYLPIISVSAQAVYSNSGNNKQFSIGSLNRNDTQSSASIALSMPLFDYTMFSKLEEAKINYLKQKTSLRDLENKVKNDYEQIINQIENYKQENETIQENIKLYDDLISANTISNEAGMTSVYDLNILKNTKKINEYDLMINDINIKLSYSKLYFKIKG